MEKLFTALESRARNYPEKKALISSDGNTQTILSNQELLDNITSTAAFLEKETVKCIGLFLDNSSQWIICDLAAAKLGITLVPIPMFFTKSQVGHLVTSAGVEAIITLSLMKNILQSNQLLKLDNTETILPLENTLMLRIVTKEFTDKKHDLANSIKITYTSGSTGEPKGVCLSAQNIGAVCEGIETSMKLMPSCNHLCVLPLATLLENVAGVYVCLMHGGVVITEPLAALGFMSNAEFDISKLLAKIDFYQVGSIIILPQMLTLLVNSFDEIELKQHSIKQSISKQYPRKQCSNLQFIAVGGGKSSKQVIKQANSLGLPVFEGYGLSECGSVVSLNLPQQQKIGSVGKPLPHVCVVISEDGEIIIEGQTMLGYLGELEQTLPRIYTGDLGYIDEDGYIFVSGRKNNKIISSFGRNISPEWVEASLSSAPVIAQIAVFGEARPSLSAVVFSTCQDTVQIEAAIKECNEFLPDYAQVQQWILAEQPFTPNNNLLTHNGRLKRLNIAKLYQEKLDDIYT
ncbi:AMP-binding protein [Colwellia psychrerythraea]|uniref:Long-chain-fatty-acid--CoA ligase n=1 Tax=Colwellia psychrerythraea TaxID=28229 RepID=A0A099KTY8_COLPS|nr:AMP-binding protein [Colwellia psychrerythraea]KGJ94021.1 Long-chain-fatty-acid--CoA ligase [Colwellia psychrerythraea]